MTLNFPKILISLCVLVFLIPGSYGDTPKTASGIPLDADWKVKVYEFSVTNENHVAWGKAHSERNFHVSVQLAKMEHVHLDTDIIFAAAFLHDIGAIPPYRKEGVEHEIRSVEVMEPLLKSFGFPIKKLPTVRNVILEHMYYHSTPPQSLESRIFHDADSLDFLGDIGVVRIVALAQNKHKWAPDLPGAFITLKGWTVELPTKLMTESAKVLARQRIEEMQEFFKHLDQYTALGTAL